MWGFLGKWGLRVLRVVILPWIAEKIIKKLRDKNATLAEIIGEIIEGVLNKTPNISNAALIKMIVQEMRDAESGYSDRAVRRATTRYLRNRKR